MELEPGVTNVPAIGHAIAGAISTINVPQRLYISMKSLEGRGYNRPQLAMPSSHRLARTRCRVTTASIRDPLHSRMLLMGRSSILPIPRPEPCPYVVLTHLLESALYEQLIVCGVDAQILALVIRRATT